MDQSATPCFTNVDPVHAVTLALRLAVAGKKGRKQRKELRHLRMAACVLTARDMPDGVVLLRPPQPGVAATQDAARLLLDVVERELQRIGGRA